MVAFPNLYKCGKTDVTMYGCMCEQCFSSENTFHEMNHKQQKVQ